MPDPVPNVTPATPRTDRPAQPLTLAETTAWLAAVDRQLDLLCRWVQRHNDRGIPWTRQYKRLGLAVMAVSAMRSTVAELVVELTPRVDLPRGTPDVDPAFAVKARAVPNAIDLLQVDAPPLPGLGGQKPTTGDAGSALVQPYVVPGKKGRR